MPVTAHWANYEKTIIYFISEKPWNAMDFQAGVLQANALIDTVQHPVDMIIEVRGGVPSISSSWPFRAAMRNFHPNIRSTALVGASDFLRRTITTFMRVMGQQHHPFFFAATLEEANQRLAERREAAAVAVEQKTL